MRSNRNSTSPSVVARVLAVSAALLLLASLIGQAMVHLGPCEPGHILIRLIDVDVEWNIPTAFSTFLLLSTAMILGTVFKSEFGTSGKAAWPWAVLSIGFVSMAVDEALSYHERLVLPMRDLLGEGPLGIFYFAWVIPGIVVVASVAAVLWRFWRRLPTGTRGRFLLAGALYVGGAIGLEFAGGAWAEVQGMENLGYSALTTIEEGLEMAGVIVFIWALLVHVGGRPTGERGCDEGQE